MDNLISKNRIIEEIGLIPEDKLIEVYNLIHQFRISLNPSENSINEIMKFAGCWEEMSEADFTDFDEEIKQRLDAPLPRRERIPGSPSFR